jgi:hypothetical protein
MTLEADMNTSQETLPGAESLSADLDFNRDMSCEEEIGSVAMLAPRNTGCPTLLFPS